MLQCTILEEYKRMPISKRDLKMLTDNELFNGMTLARDDGDGLNEMDDELASRPRH